MIARWPEPSSPLHRLVDVLWYFDLPEPSSSGFERVLPTGTFEFVFVLDRDASELFTRDDLVNPVRLSGAIACGPHTQYFALQGGRGGRVAGVHFHPGGAWPWLGDSAARLANRFADLQDVLGLDTAAVRKELAALTGDALLQRLEQILVSCMRGGKTRSPAVAYLLDALASDPFTNPLPAVRRRFGVTAKGLGDACKREVGLAPKKFARVLRFQEVLKHIDTRRPVPWADIAHRCGYYDQAHFTRDFRAFCGFSPGEYLSRVADNRYHVAE